MHVLDALSDLRKLSHSLPERLGRGAGGCLQQSIGEGGRGWWLRGVSGRHHEARASQGAHQRSKRLLVGNGVQNALGLALTVVFEGNK